MENNTPLNELLKRTRTDKKISPEKVFKDTYMPVKFIHMLEKGDWQSFPSEAHLKGYLRLYASYLKIDSAILETCLKKTAFFESEEKKEEEHCSSMEKEEKPFVSAKEKKKICLLLILSLIFTAIFILILHLLPE